MSNKIAPEGSVYVCLACGKRSKDKYGDDPINSGWDVSCVLNSEVFKESQLEIVKNRVVKVSDEAQ